MRLPAVPSLASGALAGLRLAETKNSLLPRSSATFALKSMSDTAATAAASSDEYVPPKVWTFDAENGGEWSSINRPTAGARHTKELPVGKHPFQLYSLATPNGVKVNIMLEELLEAGVADAEYDAWLIKISDGDQFSSGFVQVNPNSKIPALLDRSDPNHPVRVFESGSILLHLANKFDKFLPSDAAARTEALNWLFWQMGAAPYLGGGFGHFYAYAPKKFQYPIDRYTMEVKRQLDVLEQHLKERTYMAGEVYSIADMAIYAWYGALVLGRMYGDSVEFLDIEKSYPHVVDWAKRIDARPAVQRGRKVNRTWGDLSDQLHERHDASDFETKTQDKLRE